METRAVNVVTGAVIFHAATYWLGTAARYEIVHFPWTWDAREAWLSCS